MIKWQQSQLLQPTANYSINAKESRVINFFWLFWSGRVAFSSPGPESSGMHAFAYRVNERVVNFINGLVTIYFNDFPLLPIIVQQANGLVKENVQPTLYCFSNIVGTLIEFASIQIT